MSLGMISILGLPKEKVFSKSESEKLSKFNYLCNRLLIQTSAQIATETTFRADKEIDIIILFNSEIVLFLHLQVFL